MDVFPSILDSLILFSILATLHFIINDSGVTMGVNREWLRADGKAGSVDLSILARAREENVKSIALRTTSELWYNFSPLDDTELRSDGTIAPVRLQFDPWARINGGFVEEAGLALKFIKKWATERRHFPNPGQVAIANAVIYEDDSLVINGHSTGPIDVAWVTEYVDPAQASSATFNEKTGLWIGEKSFAHF